MEKKRERIKELQKKRKELDKQYNIVREEIDKIDLENSAKERKNLVGKCFSYERKNFMDIILDYNNEKGTFKVLSINKIMKHISLSQEWAYFVEKDYNKRKIIPRFEFEREFLKLIDIFKDEFKRCKK